MTSAVTETSDGTVPVDTFGVRLAIVRAVQGWNYDQAEAATGINSESWRTWEKGTRKCSDVVGQAQKISAATGMSWRWISTGGPLADPELPRRDSNLQPAGRQALHVNGRFGAEILPFIKPLAPLVGTPRCTPSRTGWPTFVQATAGDTAA